MQLSLMMDKLVLKAILWQIQWTGDEDPGPWGPCVVDAANKFTRTAEVLWRKRDGMATLSERGPWPLPGQTFIAFLGKLHRGWSLFTVHRFALGGYLLQKTKERMLLITSKKDICKR